MPAVVVLWRCGTVTAPRVILGERVVCPVTRKKPGRDESAKGSVAR